MLLSIAPLEKINTKVYLLTDLPPPRRAWGESRVLAPALRRGVFEALKRHPRIAFQQERRSEPADPLSERFAWLGEEGPAFHGHPSVVEGAKGRDTLACTTSNRAEFVSRKGTRGKYDPAFYAQHAKAKRARTTSAPTHVGRSPARPTTTRRRDSGERANGDTFCRGVVFFVTMASAARA